MAEFDDKVNGQEVDGTEYSAIVRELKSSIVNSGQSINPADDEQVIKGVANYVGAGDFYLDVGTANNYLLASVNSFKTPTDLLNGLRVRFRPYNNSTGASTVTLPGLPSKAIKKADGTTDVTAGDLSTINDIELRYDGTVFRISTVADIASQVEVDAGTNDTKYITPLKLKNTPLSAIEFISEAIISNDATVDFTNLSSGYSAYKVILENVDPATNGVYLTMIVSTDNGSTFKSGASDYRWTSWSTTADGVSRVDWSVVVNSSIVLSGLGPGFQLSNAFDGKSGEIFISNPSSSSNRFSINFHVNYVNSGGPFGTQTLGYGYYDATTAVNAIRFLFSSGNLNSGKIKLYGIK